MFIGVSAFSASEMCEFEPQSKSLTISKLEGMEEKWREGGRLKYLLPCSFLHSVVRMLDFPIKVSGQNNGGGYCTQRLKSYYSPQDLKLQEVLFKIADKYLL
jgi:hypothetical protein